MTGQRHLGRSETAALRVAPVAAVVGREVAIGAARPGVVSKGMAPLGATEEGLVVAEAIRLALMYT